MPLIQQYMGKIIANLTENNAARTAATMSYARRIGGRRMYTAMGINASAGALYGGIQDRSFGGAARGALMGAGLGLGYRAASIGTFARATGWEGNALSHVSALGLRADLGMFKRFGKMKKNLIG